MRFLSRSNILTGLAIAAAVAALLFLVRMTAGKVEEASWQRYATTTFSASYPPDFAVDAGYVNEIAPGRTARGVKFTIPARMVGGTNLAADSYVSIEQLPMLVACTATPYLQDAQTLPYITEDGQTYMVASQVSTAGQNRYAETVFTRKDDRRCFAVRYYLHTTLIGPVERGVMREFNPSALIEQFDRVRRSVASN